MTMQLAFETVSPDAARLAFRDRAATMACPHVDEHLPRTRGIVGIDDALCGFSLAVLLLLPPVATALHASAPATHAPSTAAAFASPRG